MEGAAPTTGSAPSFVRVNVRGFDFSPVGAGIHNCVNRDEFLHIPEAPHLAAKQLAQSLCSGVRVPATLPIPLTP